ncbi:hypothetical protein GCM10019016_130390 [Streptomyces prasinosporus]|uniref:Uncharacterized protein n=1 Tax=Streptomyces prasinosporus TaxID=68256 RepID=A0ABP6UGC2_9ACTN
MRRAARLSARAASAESLRRRRAPVEAQRAEEFGRPRPQMAGQDVRRIRVLRYHAGASGRQ